jgi:hypothetical protein
MGGFKAQYDLDKEVHYLIRAAHEGHLNVNLCTANRITYELGVSFLSASQDGIKPPLIYTSESLKTGGKKLPSEVKLINGQDSVEFLQEVALRMPFDLDAAFNSVTG